MVFALLEGQKRPRGKIQIYNVHSLVEKYFRDKGYQKMASCVCQPYLKYSSKDKCTGVQLQTPMFTRIYGGNFLSLSLFFFLLSVYPCLNNSHSTFPWSSCLSVHWLYTINGTLHACVGSRPVSVWLDVEFQVWVFYIIYLLYIYQKGSASNLQSYFQLVITEAIKKIYAVLRSNQIITMCLIQFISNFSHEYYFQKALKHLLKYRHLLWIKMKMQGATISQKQYSIF